MIQPESRTAGQKATMLEYLKKVKFFVNNKIKNKGILEMCEEIKHEKFDKGYQICTFGQRGETFHILLNGHVSIWLPVNPENAVDLVKKTFSIINNSPDKFCDEINIILWKNKYLDFEEFFMYDEEL